jgi:hypothetical protein
MPKIAKNAENSEKCRKIAIVTLALPRVAVADGSLVSDAEDGSARPSEERPMIDPVVRPRNQLGSLRQARQVGPENLRPVF